jgi:hypothetical protein
MNKQHPFWMLKIGLMQLCAKGEWQHFLQDEWFLFHHAVTAHQVALRGRAGEEQGHTLQRTFVQKSMSA